MPALSLDLAQTKLFTSILKKQKGDLRLRAFYPSGHPFKSSDSGRKGEPKRQIVEEWQNEGRGVYAVINDGGDTDSEITACRAVFCEWDDRPKEWQIDAWQDLGLPEPTLQVDTGGKSGLVLLSLAVPVHNPEGLDHQDLLRVGGSPHSLHHGPLLPTEGVDRLGLAGVVQDVALDWLTLGKAGSDHSTELNHVAGREAEGIEV